MKNAPVVVIRNRDSATAHRGKYRVRNLLTGEINYSNSVTLLNPVFIGNVDVVANLEPERIMHCDWAVSGSLGDANRLPKKADKRRVNTDHWGMTFDDGDHYNEEDNGPLAALHFGKDSDNRFLYFAK